MFVFLALLHTVGLSVLQEAFPFVKGTLAISLSLTGLEIIALFCSDIVYIAPSGVQKERILPSHIFVLPFPQPPPSLHTDRIFLRRPSQNLKESACTPLFWNAFDLRSAGSCIHTHSQHAVMATLLWSGGVFTISHQEMIKGVRVGGTGRALSYLDTLVVPIIENTPNEEDLKDSMADVCIDMLCCAFTDKRYAVRP